MKPQTRGYLNEFDDAVPPQELRDVRDAESGVISRVWNGTRHGWTFKCFGALSRTSRALLNSLGFSYQSRKWTRWGHAMTKRKSSDPLKLMLAEMARVLDADFSADKPLSFPREDMAVEISGDWGGSIQQARAFIEAAWRMGFEAATRKPTLPAARPIDLTGPQCVALFFLRDKTATGGAYAGNIRRQAKLATLRALCRLGLVEGDTGDVFRTGTYVTITPRGRTATLNLPRPTRSLP